MDELLISQHNIMQFKRLLYWNIVLFQVIASSNFWSSLSHVRYLGVS